MKKNKITNIRLLLIFLILAIITIVVIGYIFNVSTENSSFVEGIYQHNNTKISFDDKKFNISLDENFSVSGSYDIKDNKTVVCNILEYTFDDPDGLQTINIDNEETWAIYFTIKDEQSIEVSNIILPDGESEILISIYNLIETGNIFLLQK